MHLKGSKQLHLFKGVSLNRLEWPRPQTLWYIEIFRCLTCTWDRFRGARLPIMITKKVRLALVGGLYLHPSTYHSVPHWFTPPLPQPPAHTQTHGQKNVIGRVPVSQETLVLLYYRHILLLTLLVCMFIHITANFCPALNSLWRFWELILLPSVLSISREHMGICKKLHVTIKANYCFIIVRRNKKKLLPRQTTQRCHILIEVHLTIY